VRILEELARRGGAGETCALATVVSTEGSSPGQAAMKMLVGESGRLAGTIGGGHVEATVEAKAQRALATGKPEVVSFTLDDDLAEEGGLICGGTIQVLVEQVPPPAAWAAEAQDILDRGRRGALLARIGDEVEHRLVRGADAEPYLENEEPRLEGDLFIEPLFRPRCVILGAGHVGRSVARIAREAGFAVAIVEDREEQAAKAEADEVVCAELEEGFERLEPARDDYVVVMTRGHGLDFRCVRAGLRSPARYVGMLASRKKTATLEAALKEGGVDTGRLHAPIGLDLAAKSAGEIAVSVVAQLIKVRRLGRGDR
jgi:xanthine dehydrogenase accessory factor